jgi:ATP-dependent helicase Lhr and Lhr-like helicase
VRDTAPEGIAVALAATDPANPWGWLLPWPALADEDVARGARRAAGTVVVLVDGLPVLYLDRDGHRLRVFADATDEVIARALPALREVARNRASHTLAIAKIGAESALRSPLAKLLQEAGFTLDYRYLRLRVK